jgi:hypothetical protein
MEQDKPENEKKKNIFLGTINSEYFRSSTLQEDVISS